MSQNQGTPCELLIDCATGTQQYRPLGAEALAAYHVQQTAAQQSAQPEQALAQRTRDLQTLAAAAQQPGAPSWLAPLARLLGAL